MAQAMPFPGFALRPRSMISTNTCASHGHSSRPCVPPGPTIRSRRASAVLARAMDDPFEILGVQADATEKQLKKAYRRLALRYHPDLNKEEKAEAKFKALREAYELLLGKGDPDAKPAMGNWEFHDWYWSFTMRQRQARAGEGPPPATAPLGEEHRGKVRSQMANLKRRAAARRSRDAGATDPFASTDEGDWDDMHAYSHDSAADQAGTHASHSYSDSSGNTSRDSSSESTSEDDANAATWLLGANSRHSAPMHAARQAAPAFAHAAAAGQSSEAKYARTAQADSSAAGASFPSSARDLAALALVRARFSQCMHAALDSHNVALQALYAQLFPTSAAHRAAAAAAAAADAHRTANEQQHAHAANAQRNGVEPLHFAGAAAGAGEHRDEDAAVGAAAYAHVHKAQFQTAGSHAPGSGTRQYTAQWEDLRQEHARSSGGMYAEGGSGAERSWRLPERREYSAGGAGMPAGGASAEAETRSRGGVATAPARESARSDPDLASFDRSSSSSSRDGEGREVSSAAAGQPVAGASAPAEGDAANSEAAADGASSAGPRHAGFAGSQHRDSVRGQLAGLRRKSAIKSRHMQPED